MAKTKTSLTVEIDGRTLELSNLDKVLYPAAGFTKGDVVDYYRAIAPALLPHLAQRALTLKRYPNGVDDKFFYEKNAPQHRPTWTQTTPVWSETNKREMSYLVGADLPTLVWVANLAALELHTSLARADAGERPTAVVFDLDPGPPAELLDCAEVALWLRDLLAPLGLTALAKTSGKKGMQIYVPLNSATTFAESKRFALAVAQLLARDHGERVLTVMTKALRAGKIFIDWGQNDPHKTTVSVYSLRAEPTPMVSTPVTWDEIETAVRNRNADTLRFTAAEVVKRYRAMGDLFAPLLTLSQTLPDGDGDGHGHAHAAPAPMKLIDQVFPPMLATLATELLPHDDWIAELKYDGFRALAGLSANQCALVSRNHLDLASRFAGVAEALRQWSVGEAVVDGEIVAPDGDGGRSRFDRLGEGHEQLIVFDLLYLDGRDLRKEPLATRRELLERLMVNAPPRIRLSERVKITPHMVDDAARRGFEGIVAKRAGSTYEGGRSTAWVKLKALLQQELALVGFTLKAGHAPTAGRQRCSGGGRDGARMIFAGRVGTGFSEKTRAQLFAALNPDRVATTEVVDAPGLRKAIWTKPRLVADIKFTEWTQDGKLRHPVFVRLRPDKRPDECVREIAGK